jgi:hypothetical protein
MSHATYQELLARRHELSPSDEATMRRHLDGCAECREIATEYDAQYTALRTLALDGPPQGLRAAILTTAGTQPAPVTKKRYLGLRYGALAAAVVICGLGLGMARGWMPFGSQHPVLTQAQAVRVALLHTVAAPYRTLPRTIKVRARLGAYQGVHPAWIVTISGPGVKILPPQAVPTGLQATPPTLLHRETAVVDGRTGAYVETFTATS